MREVLPPSNSTFVRDASNVLYMDVDDSTRRSARPSSRSNRAETDAPTDAPIMVAQAGAPNPAGQIDAPAPLRPGERAAVQPPGDAAARTREIEALRQAQPRLQEDEITRSQYLQQTLTNLARLYTDIGPRLADQSIDAYMQASREAITQRQERLRLEQEAGVFGPA